MPYVLSVIDKDGQDTGFLTKVDFEYGGPGYPTGTAESSPDIHQAILFDTAADAIDFMMTQSKSCPIRPDGEPNRPLRALNLHIMKIEPQKLN